MHAYMENACMYSWEGKKTHVPDSCRDVPGVFVAKKKMHVFVGKKKHVPDSCGAIPGMYLWGKKCMYLWENKQTRT
jgi:hypothetical protein